MFHARQLSKLAGPRRMMAHYYLENLNEAQRKAVRHPPNVPLQILAGPGSGKTKVLTSRIAHLIMGHGLSPHEICAVTFTNKAAAEMRVRLSRLIGEDNTSKVTMGTFHALCARFLRVHASVIGLEHNFTVCDADESKKMIKTCYETYKDVLEDSGIVIAEAAVASIISKAKAEGHSAADFLKKCRHITQSIRKSSSNAPGTRKIDNIHAVVAKVYQKYQDHLRAANSLDFDDLLMYGVELLSRDPTISEWCRHILVDEFQDTNDVQFKLMQHIATSSRCVTIVGDPDQSIYGWRSANTENLSKMQKAFPLTRQIFLEQNYRSTASILNASMAIVEQVEDRIPKTLRHTHAGGLKPVLQRFYDGREESAFIVRGIIKKLVAATGGMLRWGDFAILLRFNAYSRPFESALQSQGIPCRVLRGYKFSDRAEVKDIVAYLQLVDNPKYSPAFDRIINIPRRGIGNKALSEIYALATQEKISPMEVAECVHAGHVGDPKSALRQKVTSFVKIILELRRQANKGASASDLIRSMLELSDYGKHLRSQPDWEDRWENVQELISFAAEFQPESPTSSSDLTQTKESHLKEARQVPGEKDSLASTEEPPLRAFIQAMGISNDAESGDDDIRDQKVNIATCHAAKGLEWPVVIIPAMEEGTFPAPHSDDRDEERRLLYVACTRAQCLLYVTHADRRMIAGKYQTKRMSRFLSTVLENDPELFTDEQGRFLGSDLEQLAQMLGREVPDKHEIERRMAAYNAAMEPCSTGDHQDFFAGRSSELPLNAWTSTEFISAKASVEGRLPTRPSHPQQNSRPLSPSRRPNLDSSSALLTSRPQSSTTSQFQQEVPPSAMKAIRKETFSSSGNAEPAIAKEIPPAMPLATTNQTRAPPRTGSSAAGPSAHGKPNAPSTATLTGGKRRLGMSRTAVGYPNKKFKPPGGLP
ncbi:UvrD-helicase-domain-containing protein [Laetiporus sulphureus 93-53]|uniref:DNA 3'-5' helicase n=1 Tax=Laetiporus sulphureus 93-53 TaxID=1314785 RepID=A0A165CCA5_9APHY|nr:UvrD-helicase-domain-containing protein [Laetiporus sulphureus 93-53]KZT02552.1 UvrD-helicase-domain-containing protein [Laetiporus sulphureus 93-53]